MYGIYIKKFVICYFELGRFTTSRGMEIMATAEDLYNTY